MLCFLQNLWQNRAEDGFLKFIKFSFVAIANIKNSHYIVAAKDTLVVVSIV
jgi:hypothetical protein